MCFKRRIIQPGLVLLTLAWAGCTPEIDKEKTGGNFYPGNADFSRYVAVGNSITSGFADGDLYRSGQISSFPAILAQQFEAVGGRGFQQPLMYDELGFGNRRKLAREEDCRGEEQITVAHYTGQPDARNQNNISFAGPFNNMGVPFAKSIDLNDPSYSNVNAYFERMASSQSSSIMDEAARVSHTFFTLWTGISDVLLWAIGGAAPTLNEFILTPGTNFESALRTTVAKLAARGAKGVVANVPAIHDLPFFNVIPYNDVILTQAEAEELNRLYLLNPGVRFSEGRNPFVILDGLTIRQLQPGEKVLITIDRDSVKCGGYGSRIPLPDKEVLTVAELAEIYSAIQQYNSSIQKISEEYNLPVFDAMQFFKDLQKGMRIDGVTYSDAYVKGGFFSLDGLHPTPRGHAILANKFIEVISTRYRSRIPLAEINRYPTVPIP